ncbi:MAG: helix-turn-helix transcriptional regulator [Clostridia bacterium]|nr:helix-turn-helix transcriptional regulator [Clostridia bacterium]
MTTGERIKDMRKKLGLTQKELAERMGVKDAVISQYETGIRMPKYETVVRFAAAMGVSPYAIIGFDDQAPEGMGGFNASVLNQYGPHFFKLMDSFTKLNEAGQIEAVKRVQELSELPRYQKNDEQKEGAAHGKA